MSAFSGGGSNFSFYLFLPSKLPQEPTYLLPDKSQSALLVNPLEISVLGSHMPWVPELDTFLAELWFQAPAEAFSNVSFSI